MKVLVYGAGAIGCYLAHVLCMAGNEVSLVARGEWKEELERNGLKLRRGFRKKDSVDRPEITESLSAVVRYDAVFAAMQYQQMGQILDDLARADTPLVVLVGNNMAAREMGRYIMEHTPVPKTVLFGFQHIGGRREGGRVLCTRPRARSMTIGGIRSEPDPEVRAAVSALFKGTRYRLSWTDDMDGWCKSHLAQRMPVAYLAYALNCDLRKATLRQLSQLMAAAREGYGLLFDLSYSLHPSNCRERLRGVRGALTFVALWIMCRTPLGREAVSDHCRRRVAELEGLDLAWETLRARRTDFPMPAWTALRSAMPQWGELRRLYGRQPPVPDGAGSR